MRRRSGEAELGASVPGVNAELWLDPADWSSTLDVFRAASGELHQRARPPRTPGTIRVSVTVLLFPMTTPPLTSDDG